MITTTTIIWNASTTNKSQNGLHCFTSRQGLSYPLFLSSLDFHCFSRSSTATTITYTSTSSTTLDVVAPSAIPSLPQLTSDEAATTTSGPIWLGKLVWYRFLVSVRRFVAMVTGRLPSLRPLLAFSLTARNGNLVYLTLLSSLSVLGVEEGDGKREGRRKKEGKGKYG